MAHLIQKKIEKYIVKGKNNIDKFKILGVFLYYLYCNHLTVNTYNKRSKIKKLV
jgi:hypothetical protein